jgi:hypothetical protein
VGLGKTISLAQSAFGETWLAALKESSYVQRQAYTALRLW